MHSSRRVTQFLRAVGDGVSSNSSSVWVSIERTSWQSWDVSVTPGVYVPYSVAAITV